MVDYGAMSEAEYRTLEMSKLNKLVSIEESETKEDETMSTGISSMNTLADLGALGGLFGSTGGYRYGDGAYASPSANAVRIQCNEELLNRNNEAMYRGQGYLADQISNNNFNNRINDIQSQIRDVSAQQASCCCDLKLEIANVEARLSGQIKDTTIAGLERDLAECRSTGIVSNQNLNTQAILNAIANSNPGNS